MFNLRHRGKTWNIARALSDFRLQITQPNRLRISPRACARVKAIRVARALLSVAEGAQEEGRREAHCSRVVRHPPRDSASLGRRRREDSFNRRAPIAACPEISARGWPMSRPTAKGRSVAQIRRQGAVSSSYGYGQRLCDDPWVETPMSSQPVTALVFAIVALLEYSGVHETGSLQLSFR